MTSSMAFSERWPSFVMPTSAAYVVLGRHLLEFLGFVSSNMRSTCSSVRPLVSGTRKYA